MSTQEKIKCVPVWQWDEMHQTGTDYTDIAQVEIYDKRMGTFRDVDAENQKILQSLNLAVGANFLEIGCGTGRLALAAASAGYCVSAVDISPVMLDYVAKIASEKGLSITLQNAGFLTMNLPANHFDAVVTSAALHHLPDVWKFAALQNIHHRLKPGGQFLLRDVVFILSQGQSIQNCLETFIHSFPLEVQPGATGHAACEYSTFDWIMDGLLEHTGFVITSKVMESHSFWAYHCSKSPRSGLAASKCSKRLSIKKINDKNLDYKKNMNKKNKMSQVIRFSQQRDIAPVLKFLDDTKFFRPDEMVIADEVITEAVAKGSGGHYKSYVLEQNGTAVGWVCWGPTPCTVGSYDIYWLGVAPSCQGQGLGRKLMDYAEEQIRLGGGRLYIVETSGRESYLPTRAFYERIGYTVAAVVKDFYAPGDDKIIYTKPVRQ